MEVYFHYCTIRRHIFFNQNSRIEQLSSYGFIGKSQIKGLYETFIDCTVEEFEKELGILRARSLAYIEGIFKSC